ncbi:hypothetical protein [Nocardia sp. NPDC050793]|uniref:hypothetical protein n=1 Tax=Nocardia sp. NPDC050793 TaxID=3155159 RepID=UPI0034083F85
MGDGGAGLRVRVVAGAYSAVLVAVLVGPLLGPGYLLLRDAVSTPRSYLTGSALGLGDSAPRAVPQDALLAAVSPLVDGGLIVKAILVLALWAAGYGAAVLVRELLRAPLAAQLVAVTVALWNPYVAERLLQGHWSLLAGYAALPWTALAAYRLRGSSHTFHTLRTGGACVKRVKPMWEWRVRGAAKANEGRGRSRRGATRRPYAETLGGWAALAGCFAAAGLTPTGALLAGITATVTVRRRHLPGTLALLVAASAPWLTATLLSGAGAEPSDPAGIPAFAARAEPGLGTLGSLAGLGGIWNADAVPDSRTTPLALLATLLLLAIVVSGISAVATAETGGRESLRIRRALLALAGAAVVLPALAATGWGMEVMEWLVVNVPGAGLLRDTQKYVALAVPAYALCAAAGCGALASRFRRTSTAATKSNETTATALAATAFIAFLVLPLFDLAWGVGGAMRTVHYPPGWRHVAERIDTPGDVAVLPAGMFRRFPYSGAAPVLDPAPRMLPNDVLQTGELPVRGRTVSGEGTRAREVETLLLQGGSAQDLARLGVEWVLVERTTPGPLGESKTTLAQLEPVYADDHLALYRVPGPDPTLATPDHRWLAVAAHLLWAVMLIGGPTLAVVAQRMSRIENRPPAVEH